MKVAFIGNMNNNHLSLTRFLRTRGVDATLLLTDREYPHFHPSADCLGDSYTHFTRQLTWGSPTSLQRVSKKRMFADLAEFDILIGCGLAPACCAHAGRSLDVFVPYGSDIWESTMFRLCRPKNIITSWRAAIAQRSAIAKLPIIHMPPARVYEDRLARLAPRSARWREGLPMVYSPMYQGNQTQRLLRETPHGDRFQKIRQTCDLMVFSAVRHAWCLPDSDPNSKGTDRLLRAIASVAARRPNLRIRLVTMEYGQDVVASKALAIELGIADSIEWLPLMHRRELMGGLLISDVACAEFVTSYDSSGVVYEALVAGKPLIMHRVDSQYAPSAPPGGLCPVLNAHTPIEIADRLQWVADHPQDSRAFGARGTLWYDSEVVDRALRKYIGLCARDGASI